MILKQQLNNHLIVSVFLWISTLVLFGLWKYLNYDSDFLIIVGAFQLIFCLPAFYLHLSYTISTFGEEIEIIDNKIILRKNGIEKTFNIDEALKVILYKPRSLDNGGIPITAMEYYRYARIITNGGEEILITCLTTLDIEEVLNKLIGLPYERKKRIAFLFWK
jgi:hypothetical protein